MSASRHGGNDRQFVAVLDRCSEIVEVADVFVIDVQVHKLLKFAIGEKPLRQRDGWRAGRRYISRCIEKYLAKIRLCSYPDGWG